MKRPRKLVLAVIDGLRPSALERALSEDRAPALAAIMERGSYVNDCVADFPSVTPVCTSSIATGTGPAAHRVPGMNWFQRAEGRYVEYGSSFQASRRVGIHTSLTDTIYNLNLQHLSRATPTVFERLDDAGVRTAGTTFLIYRGRHRHTPTGESALARLVSATLFRHAVWGPRELFYADMFATRKTGCRSQLGLPGARDAHAGCVGAYMVEHDLFDLLLSLPDNDAHSHKLGPEAQVDSAEEADRQLTRLMEAAGGTDAFLDEHAVIVLADHAHSLVEERISLLDVFAGRDVLAPDDPEPERARLAVCPGQRFAMVYALDPAEREAAVATTLEAVDGVEGIDLALWREDGRAVVRAGDGAELRFSPGGRAGDVRGERWTLDGRLGVLEGSARAGVFDSEAYPDALARVWSALSCPTAGDVLLSAAPGYEFVDWGGADHLGGGSHGSLHREDSLGPLLWCGCGPPDRDARAQWTLRDILPMVLEHFGVGEE
jgi:hypothetical protein